MMKTLTISICGSLLALSVSMKAQIAQFSTPPQFAPAVDGWVTLVFNLDKMPDDYHIRESMSLAEDNAPILNIVFDHKADNGITVRMKASTSSDPGAWLKVFDTLGIEKVEIKSQGESSLLTTSEMLNQYHQ